jgi:hypothetical protein
VYAPENDAIAEGAWMRSAKWIGLNHAEQTAIELNIIIGIAHRGHYLKQSIPTLQAGESGPSHKTRVEDSS